MTSLHAFKTMIGAMALAAALPSSGSVAQTRGQSMLIELAGAAEGPGLGDPDGSGTAELLIDVENGRFCYVLTVEGIAPARLAHIHQSPVGEAGGPIVVTLQPPTDGDSEGCIAISPELARSLVNNRAAYYVNVHNVEHPGGAVRGQLG
ncbi:MAG TPA: CHRD domain-containing protein [Brevundimonas sp.]|nr:CHRD domain-containing protein [Brevundimonas sp.]